MSDKTFTTIGTDSSMLKYTCDLTSEKTWRDQTNEGMTVNGRFLWAVNILQIQPQDRVLEIGCGAGLLVDQIASRLSTGSVTAIDRSAAMIKMALKKKR